MNDRVQGRRILAIHRTMPPLRCDPSFRTFAAGAKSNRQRTGRLRDEPAVASLHVSSSTGYGPAPQEDLVLGEGFAVDACLIPADANKARSIAAKDWSEDVAGAAGNRAASEYLETLDGCSPVPPKFVAKSDPAAQWARAEESRPYFAYATNDLIDTKRSVIMGVEATRAIRQAEVGASQTMLDRTEKRFGVRPDWLAADTAYGSSDTLGWLVKKLGTSHNPARRRKRTRSAATNVRHT